MTTTTNRPNTTTCPDCGTSYLELGPTRTYAMLTHMVNAGELTVGEARDELTNGILDQASAAFLAGWVTDRADQGDSWRAGDPVTLPCGCRVSYDGTQADAQCDRGDRCDFLRRALFVPC